MKDQWYEPCDLDGGGKSSSGHSPYPFRSLVSSIKWVDGRKGERETYDSQERRQSWWTSGVLWMSSFKSEEGCSRKKNDALSCWRGTGKLDESDGMCGNESRDRISTLAAAP